MSKDMAELYFLWETGILEIPSSWAILAQVNGLSIYFILKMFGSSAVFATSPKQGNATTNAMR